MDYKNSDNNLYTWVMIAVSIPYFILIILLFTSLKENRTLIFITAPILPLAAVIAYFIMFKKKK